MLLLLDLVGIGYRYLYISFTQGACRTLLYPSLAARIEQVRSRLTEQHHELRNTVYLYNYKLFCPQFHRIHKFNYKYHYISVYMSYHHQYYSFFKPVATTSSVPIYIIYIYRIIITSYHHPLYQPGNWTRTTVGYRQSFLFHIIIQNNVTICYLALQLNTITAHHISHRYVALCISKGG